MARGETLAFDAQQARAHAGHHPEVCRWRDGAGAVRRCLPAALVDEFAALLEQAHGWDPARAVADVVAWARQDAPPAGHVARGNEFAYWRERWDATRATALQAPRSGSRGTPAPAVRTVADAESTDALIASMTGARR